MPSPFFASPSTRLKLEALLGTSNGNDIDAGFAKIVANLEAHGAGYEEGTLAGRPAAGRPGVLYRATDTGLVFFDNGTSWLTVMLAGAWVPLTPAGAFSADSGFLTLAARVEGDGVRLKGAVENAGSVPQNTLVSVLPSTFRPSGQVKVQAQAAYNGGSFAPVPCYVDTSGDLIYGGPASSSGLFQIAFDGATYSLS